MVRGLRDEGWREEGWKRRLSARRGRSCACFCQAATRAAALIQYNTVERVEMRGSEPEEESWRGGYTRGRECKREKVRYDSKMLCVSVSNRLDLYAPSPFWKTQQTARGCVRFSRVCFARALLPASPLFSRYSTPLYFPLCCFVSLSPVSYSIVTAA